MVFVSGHRPGHPGACGLVRCRYGRTFQHVSFVIVGVTQDALLCRGSLRHVMVFVVLILERISLRVRHSGHIQIVIVLKLLLLVLQIRHCNNVIVLIVRKRLPEALLKQGQAVEKCKVCVAAISIGDLHAGISNLCHVHVAEELPVEDVRAEVGVMHIRNLFAVLILANENDFHAKPAVLIRGFRQRIAASPGIDHEGIAIFSTKIKCLCQLFVLFRISLDLIDMGIQSGDLFFYRGCLNGIVTHLCRHVQLGERVVCHLLSDLYAVPRASVIAEDHAAQHQSVPSCLCTGRCCRGLRLQPEVSGGLYLRVRVIHRDVHHRLFRYVSDMAF